MLMATHLIGFGAQAAAVACSYVTGATSTSDLTTYTFATTSLGAESSQRDVVVAIMGVSGSVGASINAGSINAVTATVLQSVEPGADGVYLGFIGARVPIGTTGDIVVTWSTGFSRMAIEVYRLTGLGSLAVFNSSSDGDVGGAATSHALNIPGGGVGLGVCRVGDVTATWTGLTEDHESTAVENSRISSASLAPASAQNALPITVTPGSGDAWSAAISLSN